MSSAIGILGGTFDPVHYGHLRLAEEMAQALSLAQIRFVPAGDPYHRTGAAHASGEHRLAMVRLAITGNEKLAADERDLARGGATYTIDTLQSLRSELGAQTAIVLLIGADAFALLHTWRRWRELFEFAHFALAERPGAQSWRTELDAGVTQELENRIARDVSLLSCQPAGKIAIVETTFRDVSATTIRALLMRGESARYLLPDAVIDYARAHKLYEGGR